MLDKLPLDILLLIANLLSANAVRIMSHVSSGLRWLLTPLVYRDIEFCAVNEWALNVLDVDDFFLHHCANVDYLQSTRRVSIHAPVHIARFNRCVAFNLFRTSEPSKSCVSLGTTDEEKAHELFLKDIMSQMRRVFKGLRSNSLRSFTWRLGTCVPNGILNQDGCIIQHQKGLAHLSLVTDSSCPHAAGHLDALPDLCSLRSLEWEGVQHPREIDLLHRCIHRNKKHLKALSIGFSIGGYRPDFYTDVLGLWGTLSRPNSDHSTMSLPSLVSLTLSKTGMPKQLQISGAPVFSSLKVLKLRACPNALEFLKALSDSTPPLQLKRFEFCGDSLASTLDEIDDISILISFLLSFRGLKHLHLKISNFARSCRFRTAIQHHITTLETLAYHEQQLAPIDDDRLWWDTRDYAPLWIFEQARDLRLHRLSALALCASPAFLRPVLEPAGSECTLQILHLRFVGLDHLHRNIQSEVIAQMKTGRAYCSCGCWANNLRRGSNPRSRCSFTSTWEESMTSDLMKTSVSSEIPVGSDLCFDEAREIVEFADWAFGPRGLPSLMVLAFGDFSYEERYQRQRFLARRRMNGVSKEPGCAESEESDWTLCITNKVSALDEDPFHGSDTFLSVCPDGSLMENPEEW
ncbi:hypothetical protein N7478_000744 [Penicillium angulare]|uniref:uncharacterized protein n=1 Tax=Penicillium angulare TaxID=116970 RepID=UPI0025422F4E|nr:uncharacterized protein N7478_000744 [Penicillium angulare]KAJ5291493.1 hypothetical protein N7478_000744 [Penicillium angulare]